MAQPRHLRRVAIMSAAMLAAMLGCAGAEAQVRSARTVLTINWGPEDFEPNRVLDAGIRDTLLTDDGPPIDFFAEYLEPEPFGVAAASEALASYIGMKYRGRHIDLVLAMTDPVLDFVTEHRALFPDAPIVYAGASLPESLRTMGAGLTGLTVGVAYAPTLNLALALHPETQRVFIVAKSPSQRLSDVARTAFREAAGRVELTYIDEATLPRLVSAVRAIPPNSLLLFLWYADDAGVIRNSLRVGETVAAASPVPVYGTSDFYIGAGFVGGVMRLTHETGLRVGEMARQVLGGRHASDIPIESARLRPTVDWRQLQRWGIDERRLPPDSVVEFRGTTLWRQYRGVILTTISVGLVQLALILGLLFERRARRLAEHRTRQHLTITAHLDRQLAMGELAASFAHELNQPLGAIRFNVEAAARMLANNRGSIDDIREILQDIDREDARASQIIERQRAMLQKREVEQRALDLNDVIRESLAIVAHDAVTRRVRIDAELCPEPCPVTGDAIMLQQVFVNLVVNAMDAMALTPAPQRRIVVQSTMMRQVAEVAVRDRGAGIAPEVLPHLFDPFVTTKSKGMGIGLTIVRGIIEAHGGTIQARNNPEGGATFSFTLPSLAAQARVESVESAASVL